MALLLTPVTQSIRSRVLFFFCTDVTCLDILWRELHKNTYPQYNTSAVVFFSWCAHCAKCWPKRHTSFWNFGQDTTLGDIFCTVYADKIFWCKTARKIQGRGNFNFKPWTHFKFEVFEVFSKRPLSHYTSIINSYFYRISKNLASEHFIDTRNAK